MVLYLIPLILSGFRLNIHDVFQFWQTADNDEKSGFVYNWDFLPTDSSAVEINNK